MSDSDIRYKGVNKLRQFQSSKEIDSEIIYHLNFNLEELKKNGIHIFGIGKLGQKIHNFFSDNNISVSGFADNNKSVHGKSQDGIVIHDPNLLNKDSIVFIASETFMNPIQKQLNKMGISKTITHLQASILFKSFTDYPLDISLLNLTEDLIDHKENYLKVFSLLKDDASKIVLDSLINYRMTGDLRYIDEIVSRSESEYFDESIIILSSSEVFFDCGGFDGDSAEHFISFSKNKFKSIHVFEPDIKLLSKAKSRLSVYHDIYFNDLGIFDKTSTLYFQNTGGSDGTISRSGDLKINTIALDEYKSKEAPTYIKLDIEGVEIEAINGAKNLIRNQMPKLAIASYHYPKHLWEVPLHVLSINTNYNLYLRHYSNSIFGSTYYFLPK